MEIAMCNCGKEIAARKEIVARDIAGKMAKAENKPYVIYKQNEKTEFDTKEYWETQGRPGELEEIIYP